MTVIQSHKKYPNGSKVLYVIASLLPIYYITRLVYNAADYYDSRQLSELTENWPLIAFTFLLSYILNYLSLIEIQVRIYDDRVEKGIMYPLLKTLRKVDVVHENEIRSIDIYQDSDLYFILELTSVNDRKIIIARNPNRLPLIREFNESLEKEGKNWHQHRIYPMS
jgi:hypothetical protein